MSETQGGEWELVGCRTVRWMEGATRAQGGLELSALGSGDAGKGLGGGGRGEQNGDHMPQTHGPEPAKNRP